MFEAGVLGAVRHCLTVRTAKEGFCGGRYATAQRFAPSIRAGVLRLSPARVKESVAFDDLPNKRRRGPTIVANEPV